ncbi:DUF1707 domain-containing protein [Kribbella sp. NPDC049227]|uniref:DUF1707 SHOCT-like domain-containing protein n=1 Tax=Kribbella sp. NPDC049227 TaxID=3364113 RepID=UPI00371E8043
MSSPLPQWRDPESRDADRRGRNRRRHDWHNHDWQDRDWHGRDGRGPDWGGPDWRTLDPREDDRREADDRSPERRRGPLRIGDTERDQAVAVLSDHFVAGRLTQTEFEERSEQATRARYADDLEPLFDDLPDPAGLEVAQGPWSPRTARPRRRQGPPPFVLLAPILMIALVITAITLAAPWLVWGMFWILLISGAHRRRWQYQNRHR